MGESVVDKKPGRKGTLTDAEECTLVEYILKCAVLGCSLTRLAADLKLKRILEARGEVWETANGLCGSSIMFLWRISDSQTLPLLIFALDRATAGGTVSF
jgi:hypothetical protein